MAYISFCHDNGTCYIIEVTDQTTRVYLAIQCMKGCESHLVKQRSILISLIKSLAHKTCPAVAVEEVLLSPQTTYPPGSMQLEIPLARVALAVVSSAEGVAVKNPIGDTLVHIGISDLLWFDSFHATKDKFLREIFAQRQSNATAPSDILERISATVQRGDGGT